MPRLLEDLEQKLRAVPSEADPRARVDVLVQCAFDIRELELWDRMVELSTEAAALATEIQYDQGLARSLGIQAFVQYIRADYRKALSSCMEALRLAAGDESSEGNIRAVLALVHWSLGNFEEALRQVERTRDLARITGDRIGEAFSFSIRGGVLHSLGEFEQAIAAHLDSLELFRAHDYTAGLARALSGLGSAYQALGLTESALECHQQSLDLAKSVDHRIGISRALNDLGEIRDFEGDLTGAIELHKQALEIRREEGYKSSEITSLFNLGACYQRLGRLDDALDAHRAGLEIAQQIEAKPKIAQVHSALAALYETRGQLDLALQHLRAHDNIKSELAKDHSATRQKAFELEAQLEMTRKDAEIHRLRNVELKEKNEELGRLLDELRRTQAQLANTEKMASLGGLVAAVTHEVNTPLGVIRSSADIAMRCADKLLAGVGDPGGPLQLMRANAQLISSATERIETLVARLKSFAGIDRSDYGPLNPVQALDEAVYLIESEMKDRVAVEREYNAVPVIHCFGAEISQVFMNLLKNACEAVEGKGAIHLGASADDKWVRISIRDTGRGIARERLGQLFQPGFNPQENRVRASLSLFTCQCIVQKHGGEIEVDSELGHGSEFRVLLPRALEFAEHELPESLTNGTAR